MTTALIETDRSTELVESAKTWELSEVAVAIDDQHELGVERARDALGHARVCGQLLLVVKGRLDHGEFLPWIKGNCEVSERQAQNYMRLARRWDEVIAKAHRGADLENDESSLTIKGALRLLESDEQEPDEEPALLIYSAPQPT